MTQSTEQERQAPIKMHPGDDLHLTVLMASHGLNFVTGKDREQLLAWGRDVWQAARASVVPEPTSDQIRAIAKSVATSPSDPVQPSEYVLAGYVAAMKAAVPQPPTIKESLTPATVNQQLMDHFRGVTKMMPAATPVAYLWQHTITGQKKALMSDDVFTAGPHWRLVGPLCLVAQEEVVDLKERIARAGVEQEGWTPVSERLPDFMDFCDWLMPMTDAKRERWILANESMATASVPGAATHWRKAQALPELTAHHPPVVKDSLTPESTVNRKVTVQVPPFTTIAQHKLDNLLAQGFRITGYSIERADIADWSPQRGFITNGGMVGWWKPHQIDRIPGAQQGQPT